METNLKERIEILEGVSEITKEKTSKQIKSIKSKTKIAFVILYVMILINLFGVIQVKKRFEVLQQQVHQLQKQ